MSIAWLSGLIILVILVIMLIAGAPIAISLAVSSICAILPILSTEPALVTGAQREYSQVYQYLTLLRFHSLFLQEIL